MAPPPDLPHFHLVDAGGHGPDDFAAAVRAGLEEAPRSLPCRFLYDHQGSLLFEEICRLLEYYPTRTERGILRERAGDIARAIPDGAAVVELGSGSAEKTSLLLDAFLLARERVTFAPVDISRSALEGAAAALLPGRPGLEVVAAHGEYRRGLAALDDLLAGRPRLVLWLGSSIGNLDRVAAARFLGELAADLHPEDRFLLGVDLRKNRAILERAYDDAAGVTARFNRNLLARVNRELGGDFDLDAFAHEARWEEDPGRVRLHLVGRRRQTVRVAALDMEVLLEEGERIHTEDAWKYSPEEIDRLAGEAGLVVLERWFDNRAWFSLNLLAPRPGSTSEDGHAGG